MIVLTRHQDNVEAINSTLRNAGLAVRCNWIRELNDLGEALAQINAHMLVAFVGQDPGDIAKVMSVSKQFGPDVPVLIARDQLDEEIDRGSDAARRTRRRDADESAAAASSSWRASSKRTTARRRSLARSARRREYRDQLKSFMAGSADAIAHVQEGIVVDANPAWLDLYGLPDADALVGTPLMDAFDAEAHAAIKGALVACLQGKWSNHSLRANALLSDGTNLPLEIELSRADFEGDPAVRLCVASKKRDAGTINEQLTDALERDAATGALQRRFFLQQLQESLSQPIKAGIRQLVAIQPDKLDATDRGRRPARDRRSHRPVRRADRRDAAGERSVRPLRRRHVRAADGARHAARRRDLGEQSHQAKSPGRCSAPATSRRPARAASASA